MEPIAELTLDLAHSADKIGVRIFAPEPDGENWSCRIEIDPPVGLSQRAHGVSSMQALVHALKMVSINLYGSELYENKALGMHGVFGGDLSIPATKDFLSDAPFPF